jgi:hypothetical protein
MEENQQLATHASRIEGLERELDEQKAKFRYLQTDYDGLQSQLEGVRADEDSVRVQLEGAKEDFSAQVDKIRKQQRQIDDGNKTIKENEKQIAEDKKTIGELQARLQEQNSQLSAKDRIIREREEEIGELQCANKDLTQEKTNFKAEKEKTEQLIKSLKAEINELRNESHDRERLEALLAEVRANAVQLQEDFTFLEQQNSELRATIEYLNTKETGSRSTHKSLESELAGFENGDQSDDEVLSISTDHPNSPEGSEPQPKASGNGPKPKKEEESEVSGGSSKVQEPEELMEKEVGETEKMEEKCEDSSNVIEVIHYIDGPPPVILQTHNPLACWLQVYSDLWILLNIFFICWFLQPQIKSFVRQIFVSSPTVIEHDPAVFNNAPFRLTGLEGDSSTSTLQGGSDDGVQPSDALAEGRSLELATSATVSEGVAPVVTTGATTLVDLVEPRVAPPLLWTTITLCLHLSFYAALYFCYLNYVERSIWLTANSLTKQYLHEFYKVPEHYGLYYRLFGSTPWLAGYRYNVHLWTKINTGLPG